MQDAIQTMDRCKEDFAKWAAGVSLHAAGQYEEALQVYHSMHGTSARIYYNMAVAYINVGDIGIAVKCLTSAVEKDKGLAIAFFQRGTLLLEYKDIQGAISDLETTRMLLRGNTFINYRPLGLFCHLHDFVVLYNLALARLLEGDDEEFRILMTEATHNADYYQREQITRTFRLFKRKRWSEIQPINVSTDAVFVPPKAVTKHLEPRRTSKSSKVVFASDENDNTPTFQGLQRVEKLRRLPDTQTSMKRKLFRKIKSTGDIKVPVGLQGRNVARRKRHSTVCSDSESYTPCTISNFSLDDKEKSKPYSSIHTQTENNSNTTDSADNGGKIVHETLANRKQNSDDSIKRSAFKIESNCVHSDVIEVSTEEKKDEDSKQVERTLSSETNMFEKEQSVSLEESNSNRKPRLNRKAKSAGDIKQKKILGTGHGSRSAGNLVKTKSKSLLPLERANKSKTFMTTLTQCIKPNKTDNRRPVPDGCCPTVVMHGCRVNGDLLSSFVPMNRTGDKDAEKEHVTDNTDENNNNKEVVQLSSKSNYSLGSVFGDRSTIVKYALTEACDVLTSSITPIIHESKEISKILEKKQKTLKKNSTDNTAGGTENKEMIRKSTKKKLAPGPPTSDIRQQLSVATQLITAIVHENFKQKVDERVDSAENDNDVFESTCSKDKGSFKGIIKDANSSQAVCKTHQVINGKSSEVSNDILKHTETHARCELMEFRNDVRKDYEQTGSNVSEQVFKEANRIVQHHNLTPYFKPSKKNSATSMGIKPVEGKQETPTYVNTEHFKREKAKGKQTDRVDSFLNKDDIGDYLGTASGDNNSERCDPVESFISGSASLGKARLKPPTYPPPPLRPSYWKKLKRKQQKQKEQNTGLNSLIGNALVASGRMLGFVADADKISAAFDSEANMQHTSQRNKVKISMKPTCKQGQCSNAELLEDKYHEYVNVSGVFGKNGKRVDDETTYLDKTVHINSDGVYIPCKICGDASTDTCNCNKSEGSVDFTMCTQLKNLSLENYVVTSPNVCQQNQPAKQEPETLDTMLMTSHELLMAFVTSNQETRQAFDAFVRDQGNITKQKDFDSSDGDGHDYVNVSRL